MTSNHPTDFQIEAAILEDKIPDAWKNDPQIASQISAYQNAQQDFLAAHPLEKYLPKNNVVSLASRRNNLTKWTSIILAIAAMFVVALKIGGIPGVDQPQDNYLGMKGNLDFGFYYQKAEGGSMLGESGTTLNTGDKIRFYYSSEQTAYLMVVGRESSGKTSLYYATSGEQAIAIKAGNNQILEPTFSLDNYQGTETYTALFADQAFSFTEAKAALDKNSSKIKQLSFIIRKQP